MTLEGIADATVQMFIDSKGIARILGSLFLL